MMFERFKKKQDAERADAVNPPRDPYAAARGEFNEVWGSFVTQARNWRFIALMLGLVVILETIGLVRVASQSKFIPYIVEVDKFGAAQSVGFADHQHASDRIKRAYLVGFIRDVRRVTVDPIMQKEAVARTFAMVAEGSAAQQKVTEYFTATNPYRRGQTETVSTDVSEPLRISDQSWQISWKETTRDLTGKVLEERYWKATLAVAENPASSEEALLLNPAGLYVTDIDWRPEQPQ